MRQSHAAPTRVVMAVGRPALRIVHQTPECLTAGAVIEKRGLVEVLRRHGIKQAKTVR